MSHYKILEKIGEGGMGVVYKAQDTKLDRIVALKFLPQHLTANEAEKARFLQEAKAASALNHPNVCTIYGIEEHDGLQFIEMEFVDGVTLRQKIGAGAPAIRFSDATAYAVQIGDALHEAHSRGIVHRDIKADNIMVNAKNHVKVMDFGLAKLKGSLKLTRTSSTVGTLAYMAPEQIQSGEVDARSDIFSFGVVVFEILAGKLPFRGEHDASMMYSILNENPESLLKLRPDLPADMERIIGRALEKDPSDRYQHVDDMVSELRRVQKQSARVSREAFPAMNIPTAQDTHRLGAAAPMTTESPRRSRKLVAAGGVVLLAALAAGYFVLFGRNQSVDSLAVLPFVNVGADPNTEYLSDGITESLINGLSQLSNLTVMSRSSVFHYKGKEIDPQKAGKELGVKAVLTGRVIQRDDNLTISAELVDVANNSHIWGDQYNRKLSDVLAVQEEISREISRKLSVKLAGEDEKKLEKRATENTEAYQLYLKGRFYWNKRRADDLKTAIDYFNQAIEKDPGYALAYAGLAAADGIMPEYGGLMGKEYTTKAAEAAKKALELDPTLAEAHAVLGLVKIDYFWDWKGAEDEYKRAIELNPNYPTAHHWYNICLSSQGRLEEALAEIKRAQELDPLSLIINTNLEEVYAFMHEYDKADEQNRKIMELDPNFAGGYGTHGLTLIRRGRYEEAIKDLIKTRELIGSGPWGLHALGYAYAKTGRRAEAQKIIEQLLEFRRNGHSVSYELAAVYNGLGEKENALKWLEQAVDDHNSFVRLLKIDAIWDNLRQEPRYIALLKKVGLY